MARRCSVGKLMLIYFPVLESDLKALRWAGWAEFDGPVELATDFVHPL
jgi:ribonuclease BN (tRNA processing enzyme)